MQMFRRTLSTCLFKNFYQILFLSIFLIFFLFLTILGLISYFLCFVYFSLNSTWFSSLVQVLGTGTEVLVYCLGPFEHLCMFWPMNPRWTICNTWVFMHLNPRFIHFFAIISHRAWDLCKKVPGLIVFMFKCCFSLKSKDSSKLFIEMSLGMCISSRINDPMMLL